MARTKNFAPMTEKGPQLGAHSPHAFIKFMGGTAKLMGTESPGYFESDSPHASQHPNKTNPGGPVRYIGDDI